MVEHVENSEIFNLLSQRRKKKEKISVKTEKVQLELKQ